MLVRQARVPVGYHSLPEIPAGMLDGSGHFKVRRAFHALCQASWEREMELGLTRYVLYAQGVAAEEIAEECNIVIGEEELVDLTELAYGDQYRGIFPSTGGSDEFYRMFVFRRAVEPEVLTELQGRLTGLLAEGEYIKLEIIPLADLWKSTPDAKALCALALFDCLKKQGTLPDAAQKTSTYVHRQPSAASAAAAAAASLTCGCDLIVTCDLCLWIIRQMYELSHHSLFRRRSSPLPLLMVSR